MRTSFFALIGLAAIALASDASASQSLAEKEEPAQQNWWGQCTYCKNKVSAYCRTSTGYKGWYSSSSRSSKGRRYKACYRLAKLFKCGSKCSAAEQEANSAENKKEKKANLFDWRK